MKKVYIATSRPVGNKCKKWAKNNTPKGFVLVDGIDECDIIISVLFNKIFSKEELLGKRAYNFHPGILPKYRGVGTISWAIINKEKTLGVSIHMIDQGVDTGDIIKIIEIPLLASDTAETAFKKTEKLVFVLFKDAYRGLLRSKYKSYKQSYIGTNYKKSDLEDAKNLTRFVRAFTFKGKENAYYFNFKGKKVYLKYH